MDKFNFTSVNNDERAVEFLKKDFAILLQGIEGKNLSEINLDAVIELLDILKNEVEKVRDGIVARDNFISHYINDVSSVFAKTSERKL